MHNMRVFNVNENGVQDVEGKILKARREANIQNSPSRLEQIKNRGTTKIGSYDSKLFQPKSSNPNDNVETTTLKGGIDYEQLKQDLMKSNEIEERLETEKVSKVPREFADRLVLDNTRKRNEPLKTLDGLNLVRQNLPTEYGSNSAPNYLFIDGLQNVSIEGFNIICQTYEQKYNLQIVGITTNFELVFQVSGDNVPAVNGTARMFKELNQLYMGIELELFNKNKPITFNINGINIFMQFIENNQINPNITVESVYEIRLLRLIFEQNIASTRR